MKTILIIDDEKRIRDIYKRIFNATCRSICRVVEAENAKDATEHLVTEKVDLVLLDLRMPVIDGPIIYGLIKESNPNVKIIVASVYPVEEQKRLVPFADDYYDKSGGTFKFLEKVTTALV